tara:strand:- start:591 stop:1178 length:588 start_codon:yes stop_codon:yes gene_type:complete
MSVKSIEAETRLVSIFEKIDILDISAGSIVSEFQDLSSQVQAIVPVGDVITAFPISRNFDSLNVEYTVQGSFKQDWSLTLSAGTYMFVLTPYVWLTNLDGDYPVWDSTSCNASTMRYTINGIEINFTIYPDLAVVPAGVNTTVFKYFGKHTMIMSLAAETTFGIVAELKSPSVGEISLGDNFAYTQSSVEYIKLS